MFPELKLQKEGDKLAQQAPDMIAEAQKALNDGDKVIQEALELFQEAEQKAGLPENLDKTIFEFISKNNSTITVEKASNDTAIKKLKETIEGTLNKEIEKDTYGNTIVKKFTGENTYNQYEAFKKNLTCSENAQKDIPDKVFFRNNSSIGVDNNETGVSFEFYQADNQLEITKRVSNDQYRAYAYNHKDNKFTLSEVATGPIENGSFEPGKCYEVNENGKLKPVSDNE